MTLTKESRVRQHTFAIGRQTGDLGDRVGILERAQPTLIPQTLYGLIENHGDVAFTVELRHGVPATGQIVFATNPTDGQTLILDDGPGAAITFEFDSNASVVESSTLRRVVIGATPADTAENFANAVNAFSTIAITARVIPHNHQTTAIVALENDQPGTAGNVALAGTSGLSKTGMTGGTGGVHNIRVAAASVANVVVVPGGRVEFVVELALADLAFLTFNASGGDDTLGELTVSYDTGDLELRTTYA